MRRIAYRLLVEMASIAFALWRWAIEHAEDIGDDDHYEQAALLSCAFCTEDDEDETSCEARPEGEGSATGASEGPRVIEAPEDDWNERVKVIMGHTMWHWECEWLFAHVPEHTHKGFNHDATL